MLRGLAIGLALCCAIWICAAAEGNSCDTWNTLCTTYHFESYPQGPGATFGDAYFGNNYKADILGITVHMNQILVVDVPPPLVDDMLDYHVVNWAILGGS